MVTCAAEAELNSYKRDLRDHNAENIYMWTFTGSLLTPEPEQMNVCGAQVAAVCPPRTQ